MTAGIDIMASTERLSTSLEIFVTRFQNQRSHIWVTASHARASVRSLKKIRL
jgi:hypothetical protein